MKLNLPRQEKTGCDMANSEKISDIPDVVIKPGKMFTEWPLKAKVGAIIFGLIVYTYIILILKGVYLKARKLDNLMEMLVQTQKLVEEVHASDKLMETHLQEFSNF